MPLIPALGAEAGCGSLEFKASLGEGLILILASSSRVETVVEAKSRQWELGVTHDVSFTAGNRKQ